MNKKSAVIIGANFAGMRAAARLQRQSTRSSLNLDVCVIDRKKDFSWTPNIHEILSGTKRPRDVILPNQKIIGRLGHRFLNDEVTGINLEDKVIQLSTHVPVAYDTCLIACGHTRSATAIADKQYQGHGFRHSDEVSELYQCIERRVARGEKFTVTIVGGGFSGVEALGELLRRYRHVAGMEIRIIERSSRLLTGLPEVIAEDVMRQAAPYQVEFLFDARILEAGEDGLTLTDGRTLHSSETIWTAGTELPGFIRNTGLDAASASGLLVEQTLQLKGLPEIFVAGDAARFIKPLRKQAYHALEMGDLAGENIYRWLCRQPLLNFCPGSKPILLSFGDLNTYLVQDQTVIASPLLAAGKELVYQAQMAKLSAALPLWEVGCGITERLFTALNNLLIPEVAKLPLSRILRHSRPLQWGNMKDIESMTRAIVDTIAAPVRR